MRSLWYGTWHNAARHSSRTCRLLIRWAAAGGQKTAACVPCGGVSCDARDDVEAASVTLSVANQAGDAAEQFPAVAAATHEGLSASGCKEAASSAADDCRMCQMDGHQRAAAIGVIVAHPAAHIGWHLGLCGDCLADASDQAYGPDLQD